MGARFLVGGEARHQRDGKLDAERLAESRGLAELPREEAAPVERLDDALDDASEPRRHPAGEHDLTDAPGSERVQTRCAGDMPARRARLGQRLEVVALGRLDDAVDDVRRGRQVAVGDTGAQLVEEHPVEPESLEQLSGLLVERLAAHRATATCSRQASLRTEPDGRRAR